MEESSSTSDYDGHGEEENVYSSSWTSTLSTGSAVRSADVETSVERTMARVASAVSPSTSTLTNLGKRARTTQNSCTSTMLSSNKHLRLEDQQVEESVDEMDENSCSSTLSLPLAPTFSDFCLDCTKWHPRPEWLGESTTATSSNGTRRVPSVTFGKDQDSALMSCIRKGLDVAALKLLQTGASIHVENTKGVTAAILAAQHGNSDLLHRLHLLGADLAHAAGNGATAMLQAAHFGHLRLCKYLLHHHRRLLELSNYHHTTPLMRASQEGRYAVVQFLLEQGALVNRKNRQSMTALMLASQRGHADICELLLQHKADVNAMTTQASTSLVLACKRQHVDAVKVLVTAGCELFVKDGRGRTARDICLQRRSLFDLVPWLDPIIQVDLMQRKARQERSWAWIRIWTLLQQNRAHFREVVPEEHPNSNILEVAIAQQEIEATSPSSTTALFLRTMTLPGSLVEAIAQFAPLPFLWDRRVDLLTKRALMDADAALESGLDLLDEVLEEGGFLEACDQALVPPPVSFHSWVTWKGWCRRNCSSVVSESPTSIPPLSAGRHIRPFATRVQVPSPQNPKSLVQRRRHANYLAILAAHAATLTPILTQAPYFLPSALVRELITCHDLASVTRRLNSSSLCYHYPPNSRSVQFHASVALDLILLTHRVLYANAQHRPSHEEQ